MGMESATLPFTASDLRRNIVVLMAQFYDDVFNDTAFTHLQWMYSSKPISPRQYLLDMLKTTTWADTLMARGLSIVWNLRVSLLYTNPLSVVRIRHRVKPTEADVVIIYNGRDHFTSTSKFSNSTINKWTQPESSTLMLFHSTINRWTRPESSTLMLFSLNHK